MGIPLFVFCCFILIAFNIFSLSLIFVFFINMCLSMFLLGFILCGTLGFLDLGDCFLSHVRDIFSYYFFKYFLWPFISLSLSETPIMQMLCLMLSQRSQILLFLFILSSVPCQQLLPFCFPAQSSVFLPYFFCYWLLLMYFSFVIVFFNSHWSIFLILC